MKKHGLVTMSNPGDFRIELADARSGGVSDPRNGALMKMFNLIDVGERAGSGIPSIFHVWKQQGWSEPTITQTSSPDRTTLSLPFTKSDDKIVTIKSGGKKERMKTATQKALIIEFLTDHAAGTAAELSALLGVTPSRVKQLLRDLITEEVIVAEGGNRNRSYRLKA